MSTPLAFLPFRDQPKLHLSHPWRTFALPWATMCPPSHGVERPNFRLNVQNSEKTLVVKKNGTLAKKCGSWIYGWAFEFPMERSNFWANVRMSGPRFKTWKNFNNQDNGKFEKWGPTSRIIKITIIIITMIKIKIIIKTI